jgi:hypothetical protein
MSLPVISKFKIAQLKDRLRDEEICLVFNSGINPHFSLFTSSGSIGHLSCILISKDKSPLIIVRDFEKDLINEEMKNYLDSKTYDSIEKFWRIIKNEVTQNAELLDCSGKYVDRVFTVL